MKIRNWLKQIKPVVGMVHLLPLPKSPRWQGSMRQVLERAGPGTGRIAAERTMTPLIFSRCRGPSKTP